MIDMNWRQKQYWKTRLVVLGFAGVLLLFLCACFGLLGDNVQMLISDLAVESRTHYIKVR